MNGIEQGVQGEWARVVHRRPRGVLPEGEDPAHLDCPAFLID
jgi:hypothetical protein